MEYMTISYIVYKDGTKSAPAIYKKDSSDEAIKGVHREMSQWMGAENVASVMAMAVNSIGGVYKNEHWVAPVLPGPETVKEEVS